VKYRVTHVTKYDYGEVVPLGHNLVHLRPRETERQVSHFTDTAITPNPACRRDRIDFFGNHLTWFIIQEPHDTLNIVSRSEVEVTPFELPPGYAGQPWNTVPAIIQSRLDPAALEARQFTFDSAYIPRHQKLADFARPNFAPGRPMLECIVELTNRIHAEFTFDAKATTVGTPILQVLEHRHGVCQDFAQLQIGCLRSLGLAARYVSGYIVTHPPPGQAKLTGSDASHAWISVFFPDFGWIDFDPTNAMIPSAEHITLGWARDYEDIGPVKGVIVGGHRHTVKVSVDVEPIGAATRD
jgi:transglutaminase-like putative cysteine protease